MFCGRCGTQNPDTNAFCKNCGSPLRRLQEVAPGAPAGQPVTAAWVAQPATGTAKRGWNWAGIGSLILGIISWILFPYLLAVPAIALGAYSLWSTRRASGRIAFIAVTGIIIAAASVLLDFFYLTLFATHNLPPFP